MITISNLPNSSVNTSSSTTSTLRTQNLESNEPAVESRPDNSQDSSLPLSAETVSLSDSSIKLSKAVPAIITGKPSAIETSSQAKQATDFLSAGFANDPAQAKGAFSNVNSGVVSASLMN